MDSQKGSSIPIHFEGDFAWREPPDAQRPCGDLPRVPCSLFEVAYHMTVPFRKQFYCHPVGRLHPLHQPDAAQPQTILSYRPKFHKVLRRYRLRGFTCGPGPALEPGSGPSSSFASKTSFAFKTKRSLISKHLACVPYMHGCRTVPKFSLACHANPPCAEQHTTQVQSLVIPNGPVTGPQPVLSARLPCEPNHYIIHFK